MSHTLFKSNNIVVLGDLVYDVSDPRILLNFIVQVNGKLVQYQEMLSLIRDISIHEWRLTVRDWKQWDSIVRLLASFGYYLTEQTEYIGQSEIYAGQVLKEWISSLNPDKGTFDQLALMKKS